MVKCWRWVGTRCDDEGKVGVVMDVCFGNVDGEGGTFSGYEIILGGGIWLSSRANNTDCLKFLQWPLIVIGASIMVVSLAGFAGACYRNTFLLWLYLFVMFFIIVALIGFIIFAYAVTDKGGGRPVTNKGYLEYYLTDYSGWLRDRVVDNQYWADISSCIRDSKVCAKMGRSFNGVPETSAMFSTRKLSPIQSGCCKPPTDCGFVYVNETPEEELEKGLGDQHSCAYLLGHFLCHRLRCFQKQ
ncbi:hypothetical protein V6N12_072368 [Hibiscus sabdariffa]|uniref:Uncharacterized protein n=1 Tax=Hibiscus sabdariffa TaxID=183260 RepID=A0ABR2FMI5_9ROSI